jgi:hypothetical protein
MTVSSKTDFNKLKLLQNNYEKLMEAYDYLDKAYDLLNDISVKNLSTVTMDSDDDLEVEIQVLEAVYKLKEHLNDYEIRYVRNEFNKNLKLKR